MQNRKTEYQLYDYICEKYISQTVCINEEDVRIVQVKTPHSRYWESVPPTLSSLEKVSRQDHE